MGTSADRAGGTGGAWTPLKVAATSYSRSAGSGGGSDGQARRLLGRHVAVLGGSAGAARSAAAGGSAMAGLGGFLAEVAAQGLPSALRSLGLQHLIGADRFDVLEELISAVAGTGSDLEAQAARDAQCDVLDDFFGDAESWADMSTIQVDRSQLQDLLSEFLARYVFNRIPAIGERLARLVDPSAVKRADRHLLDMIRATVVLNVPGDPLDVDWRGSQGKQIIDEAIADVYRNLEAMGDDDL